MILMMIIHTKFIPTVLLISNNSNNQSRIFDNVTLKDLKLIGRYDVTINSTGTLTLPSKDSQHEYFGISIPPKSNMTVNLYPDGHNSGQIVTLNGSSVNTIKVDNDSTINFYNISGGCFTKIYTSFIEESRS